MTKLQIKLNEIDEIKSFAAKVVKVSSDVDIIKGSTVYDAKSIMAIFYLGSLDPVYVEVHTEDEDEIRLFNELMAEFLVEGEV
jgi:phosphotransferase system HPr-like phosphotransfer protein